MKVFCFCFLETHIRVLVLFESRIKIKMLSIMDDIVSHISGAG